MTFANKIKIVAISSICAATPLSAHSSDEVRIAYAGSMKTEIVGRSDWCSGDTANLTFKSETDIFDSNEFHTLFLKVSKAVLPAECPNASIANIIGMVEDSEVFKGSASAYTGWKVIETDQGTAVASTSKESDAAAVFDLDMDMDIPDDQPLADAPVDSVVTEPEQVAASAVNNRHVPPPSATAAVKKCKIKEDSDVPDERFSVAGDGTVIDRQYGLRWTQCPVGMNYKDGKCLGEAKRFTWHEAKKIRINHEILGVDSWSLPDKRLAESIRANECDGYNLNQNIFVDFASRDYWGRKEASETEGSLIWNDEAGKDKNATGYVYLVSRVRVQKPDWSK